MRLPIRIIATMFAALLCTAPAAADTDLILRHKEKVNQVSENEVGFAFSANRQKTLWFRVGSEIDTNKGVDTHFMVFGATLKGRSQDIVLTVVPRKEVSLEVRVHL